MIVTKLTKRISIFSLTFAIVVAVGAAYFFLRINQQGAQLDAYIAVISESTQQAENRARTERTLTETEAERAQLANVFFKDQSDSLNFLTYVEEELAPQVGVELETLDIAVVAVPNSSSTSEIKMRFAYTGSEEAVITFSRLLETLPYHSRIEALILRRVEEKGWEGEVTLHITVSSI